MTLQPLATAASLALMVVRIKLSAAQHLDCLDACNSRPTLLCLSADHRRGAQISGVENLIKNQDNLGLHFSQVFLLVLSIDHHCSASPNGGENFLNF